MTPRARGTARDTGDELRLPSDYVIAYRAGSPSAGERRRGEEVAAAVVLRAGVLRGEPGAADEAALIAFLGSRLARFKRPSRIHVVDELPLTSSGKIRRFVLRERFARA